MAENQHENAPMASLSKQLDRFAGIEFPTGLRTFHLTEQCIGTEVTSDPAIFRSETDPIVINHSKKQLQIWAKLPLERAIRVVLVDYRERPKDRKIIGFIWFGVVPADVQVSDFVISIHAATFPDTLKNATVYILGMRAPVETRNRIPLTLKMRDIGANCDHFERIELIDHGGNNKAYIRCSQGISQRAGKQDKPQKNRYLPGNSQSRVEPIPNSPKPALKIVSHEIKEPVDLKSLPQPSPDWYADDNYIDEELERILCPSVNRAGDPPTIRPRPNRNTGAIPKRPIRNEPKPRLEIQKPRENPIMQCTWCNESFSSDQLEVHCRNKHPEWTKCSICNLDVPAEYLRRHRKTHEPHDTPKTPVRTPESVPKEIPYANCPICIRDLPLSRMDEHMNEKHPEWVMCRICDVPVKLEFRIEHQQRHAKDLTPLQLNANRLSTTEPPKFNLDGMWGPRKQRDDIPEKPKKAKSPIEEVIDMLQQLQTSRRTREGFTELESEEEKRARKNLGSD